MFLMKKRFLCLTACFVPVLLCLFFARAMAEEAFRITVTPEEATVEKDRGLRLTVKTSGAGGQSVAFTWTSSDATVASVKADGTVFARNAGETVITCTAETESGERSEAQSRIRVVRPVNRVELSFEKCRLVPTETITARASVLPEGTASDTVHWQSSDESVATVDENGLITAVRAGKAAVTAISDADPTKKASLSVIVLQPVTDITIEDVPPELPLGKNQKLKAAVEPTDASDTAVNWESSDRSVMYILNGVLVPRSTGFATLICIAADGSEVSASQQIEIYEPVASLRLSAPETVYLGTPVRLTAEVKPADAKYRDVAWSVSDPRLATVDKDGLLTPLGAGQLTVTATAGDKKASVQMKIVKPVTSLKLDRQNGELKRGGKLRLSAVPEPADATDKRVIWTSSDPSVASVQNGTVTAKKGGFATITATAPGGDGVTAVFTLKVTQLAEELRFESKKAAVGAGKTMTPALKLLPDGVTDTEITWTSSEPAIAETDESTGLITGMSAGTCLITARDALSGKTDSFTLIVEPELPLGVDELQRSGKHEAYSQFGLPLRSTQTFRSMKGASLTVTYDCAGTLYSHSVKTAFSGLKPGQTQKTGPWEVGYQLTYAKDFMIYINSVTFSDGTVETFEEGTLIGSFD